MGWVETEKPQVARDLYGQVTGRRFFKIDGHEPAQLLGSQLNPNSGPSSILGGPSGTLPLPKYGEKLSADFPQIKLMRYTTQSIGQLVFHAIAEYEFNLVTARHASFQTETPSLPFARLVKSYVGDPTQGRFLLDWKFEEQPSLETVVRRGHKVIVDNVGDYDEFEYAIFTQTNKLMRFPGPPNGGNPGLWMRFEAGDIMQLGPVTYSASYNFIYDAGTRFYNMEGQDGVNQGGGLTPDGQLFYPTNTQIFNELYPQSAFIRPPFCTLELIRSQENPVPNDPPPLPTIRWLCRYEISGPNGNGQGWRSLPGILP